MTHPLAAKIRGFCAESVWEQGQRLIDAEAVQLDNCESELLEIEIIAAEAQETNHVILMLDIDDWGCDCTYRERVCAHVAAAATFLNSHISSLQESKLADERTEENERVCRFDNQNGMLCLRPGFDLSFKFELSHLKSGPIPSEHMMALLETLSQTCPVELDDRPIEILAPACGLCLRISDHPDGILARLEQEPGITDVFNNGAVRRGNFLQAISHHHLPQKWFTVLRKGRIFKDYEIAPFSRRVLPDLSKKLPIFVDSTKLSSESAIKPYIELSNSIDRNDLVLHAKIAYGSPPVARIESGKMILIRGHEIPVRIASLEALLAEYLQETFSLEIDHNQRYAADEAIRISQYLDEIRFNSKSHSEIVIIGDAYQAFLKITPLKPRIRAEENDDYELLFVESNDSEDDSTSTNSVAAQAVLNAWEQGQQFVELSDGSLGQLPAEWLAEYGDRVVSLLASRSQRGTKNVPLPHELWDLAEICRALNHPSPFGADRLAAVLANFSEVPSVNLPHDLTAVLRDYQRQGVNWLSFLRDAQFGALLADDMGLGKTIQALCTVLETGKTLVVAPTSVIHNWANEIRRFRPSLHAHLYHGSNREIPNDCQVILTTYAILRIDQVHLAGIHWDCVVLDEAQAIKNSRSKVAQAAFSLTSRFRMVLTGTPIENRLEDLWSQFHFLNRGLLGGRKHFLRQYVNVGDTSESRSVGTEALRKRIKPFILRRTKSEVELELPSRTEIVLHSELNADERKIYDSIRFATQEQLVSVLDQKLDVMAMLEALLRLRQCACHPALLPGYGQYLDRSSSKIQLLIETLKETLSEGHRSLIYSQWTSFLDLIEHDLRHKNIPFLRLDGQTRNRQAIIEKFAEDDAPPIMLISLKAGGTGINLTSADHVFLMDPWWNPAVEDQAADRVHRIGQTRPVLIHRLVSRHTVEDRILALQAKKRNLAESTVGAMEHGQNLTREDLLLLLDA